MVAASVLVSSNFGAGFAGTALASANSTQAPAPEKPAVNVDDIRRAISIDTFEPYYLDVLKDWESKGYKPGTGSYRIAGYNFSAQSELQQASVGSYEGKSNVLIWKSDRENWVEYKVNITQAGLYEFVLQYHPYNDPNATSINRRPVPLAVSIDGEFPFREARAVNFRRLFKDELPVKRDRNDDDIRPRPIEIKQWLSEPFRDNGGAYSQPLKWYLSAGEHTIRLAGSEPVVIESIQIQPPQELPSYEEYLSKVPNTKPATSEAVKIEAEEMTSKNDVAIQMVVSKDALAQPLARGHERFNAVGGSRWQNGGQKINWKFTVPEDGLYRIAMRAQQNTISNMSTHRTIEIDGEVPFKELLEYKFPYHPSMRGVTLSDSEGNPYEFYLTKGEHVLSMTATVAPFQSIIVQSEETTLKLRDVSAILKALTGNVIDKNRTWRIEEEFPELPQLLREVRDELVKMGDEMEQANGRIDNVVQTIRTAIKDIETYLRYPNEIPYYMEEISSMQEKIGGLRETLIKAPLLLEQIYIVPSDADNPKLEANVWEKFVNGTYNFFYSFIRKDDITDLDEKALNVWVNRGRDYVNLLQDLADQLFTPQTGIPVKVNLLPDQDLLIYANAAGIAPDIALGQPQDKSVDFAMRNALLDLSQFPDFKEVASQFAPGALLPFYYDGGYYALPETQSFKVLFYRKDILAQLGLELPDTWEDVYNMLPTLQQNGYNFYIPHTDFITFIYQNGAEFFDADGMGPALDTPEAFRAFKQWTDMFNIYDVERNVPSFYQHFRKGTMPIGVADYNTYVTLSVAAPELTGWWGIAPLPGVKQPDGTVARWSSGGQTTGFIYKSSKKKEEAWTFLKWLLSADIQETYGNDLESFNGIQFRWNTANVEAFTRLPYPQDDLNVILEQWRWYKEMPNPPGAYFVGRELNNAWTRTVVSGMNYRESLEEGIVNIEREMIRKYQEFGFIAADGTILKTMDLPQVKKPWEGVDKYVKK
jgi:ABC-type glycerol-3-phosphate transport system substrate-binding protein